MRDTILIPERLQDILSQDSALYAAVSLTLREFEPWLSSSGMPFFTGFTDHSPTHIREVLVTGDELISEVARSLLTPADVAVLVLAVLLHDCAMHLTEDGFRQLITPAWQGHRLQEFGDQDWIVLWREFLSEASRFNDRTLANIFGDREPLNTRLLDVANLSERDKLLVGEFVRRHHARLAHEIALVGVPGPVMPGLRLRGVPEHFADLAGLVARSHNLSVRDTYPYLERRYDRVAFKHAHPVFLMCVLRIADYLQLQATRAPSQILKVKRLRTGVSQREWQAHAAIRDIRNTHNDPEALFIDAAPPTPSMFRKLKLLFRNIQYELDHSWACLGETYGRYSDLAQLGLRIRRIRSSLDDVEVFSRNVNYVPVAAPFSTADTSLLKLLVGPLYASDPAIGIRELLQNAIDACRELDDLAQSGLAIITDRYAQEDDVVVTIGDSQESTPFVTVTDRGTGMTAEIICNYFLRAGASYRSSDAWRRDHQDASGCPRVLRGGRFGVGVLAAFLLGDRVEVTTRHFTAARDKAISFVAELDADAVELWYCEAPIGTSVRIQVSSQKVWRAINPVVHPTRVTSDRHITGWYATDWYSMPSPSIAVHYVSDKETFTMKPDYTLPYGGDALLDGWHRFEFADYQSVFWTNTRDAPALAVNGITVCRDQFKAQWGITGERLPLPVPRLSVLDPQGQFPLNLQRTAMAADSLPFERRLYNELCRDFVARLLVRTPTELNAALSLRAALDTIEYYPQEAEPNGPMGHRRPRNLMVTKQGVSLADPGVLKQLRLTNLVCVRLGAQFDLRLLDSLPEGSGLLWYTASAPERLLLAVTNAEDSLFAGEFFSGLGLRNGRTVLTKKDFNAILKRHYRGMTPTYPRGWRKRLVVEFENETHVLVGLNENHDNFGESLFQLFVEYADEPVLFNHWHVEDPSWNAEDSILASVWLETLGQAIVPFEQERRRSDLATAYATLGRYVDQQQKVFASSH